VTRKLFGTDGVRGVAGEFLSAELALSLARAATARLPTATGCPRVVLIRDTRESGEMLEAAVAAGVAEAGGEALLAGVLPTPAAPLLIGRYGFDAGVVISASHNPYRDNGIKFFGSDGHKLSDATELEIERALEQPAGAAAAIGRVRALHGALEDYLRGLEERFAGLDLAGRRIALDCAHGATYRAAPEIFRRLGADVTVLADAPDGRNINAGCGSTHLGPLMELMAAGEYDAGFAFDGDGDRALAVDRTGAVVDGDELIALAALHLREQGRLPGGGVAVTVMTNYGFHTAMRAAGVEVVTTDVGDRYVLEVLRERGWGLGGEQSGHIIDMGFVPSGDGIASALLALEALGLSLVLGVMRLINLVHGELVILGAYLGYVLLSRLGLDPLAGLLLVAPALALLAYPLQRVLLLPLLGRGPQAPLLTTFGLSVIAQNLFVLVFHADTRSLSRSYATAPLDVAGLQVPAVYAISFAVALVVVGGVHLLVRRTGVGREIRAASEDPVAAAVLGVDVGRVYARTYALGTACAGVGGVLVGLAFSFTPTTGTGYLLTGFAVVVLGGLGSVLGTLIGGIGLGVIESVGGAFFGDGYRDFIGLAVFLAFLALRPQGVLGRAER